MCISCYEVAYGGGIITTGGMTEESRKMSKFIVGEFVQSVTASFDPLNGKVYRVTKLYDDRNAFILYDVEVNCDAGYFSQNGKKSVWRPKFQVGDVVIITPWDTVGQITKTPEALPHAPVTSPHDPYTMCSSCYQVTCGRWLCDSGDFAGRVVYVSEHLMQLKSPAMQLKSPAGAIAVKSTEFQGDESMPPQSMEAKMKYFRDCLSEEPIEVSSLKKQLHEYVCALTALQAKYEKLLGYLGKYVDIRVAKAVNPTTLEIQHLGRTILKLEESDLRTLRETRQNYTKLTKDERLAVSCEAVYGLLCEEILRLRRVIEESKSTRTSNVAVTTDHGWDD